MEPHEDAQQAWWKELHLEREERHFFLNCTFTECVWLKMKNTAHLIIT